MIMYELVQNWKPTDGVELTDEQLAVVRDTQNNLAIIAGPGTGKTEVLAQKATFLLQTRTCAFPYKILALCYKVDAAANIKSRVKKRCPKELAYRFHAMTIDSFLISIIRRFSNSLPEWLKIKPDFEISLEKLEEQYVKEEGVKNFPDLHNKNVKILTCPEAEKIKDFYQYLAKKNKFNHKICHTLAYYILATNKDIREIFSKTYRYVFLDEFQDMVTRHYEILKLIFNENNILNAVGDHNQAIMLFAGAVPEIFNIFIQKYKAELRYFRKNFRSSSKITNFINELIKDITPQNQSIVEYKGVGEQVDSIIESKKFYSVEDEATYIVNKINEIKQIAPELLFGDFVIIIRQKTDDYCEQIQPIFNEKNILVRNEDKIIKGKVSIQDLMVDDFSTFIINMLKLKYSKPTVDEHNSVINLLAKVLALDLERSQDLKKIFGMIQKIIKLDFITADNWVDEIINIIGAIKLERALFNNKKEYNETVAAIKIMLQKCYDDSSDNLSSVIDKYLGKNTVKVMTTHKSKGLEFDTVFFADFTDKSWWKIKQDSEEELKCFFVGLTRAKKRLFFTTSDGKFPVKISRLLETYLVD